ncbi:DoxX family protein [Nocardioides pacificus]
MTSTRTDRAAAEPDGVPRTVGRYALAGAMLLAGVGHMANTEEFRAQVPPFFPARDAIVYASGVVELGIGAALLAARGERRVQLGFLLAAFFVVIFPGNVSQYLTGEDAFGLDTDRKRAVRLVFQPVLVLWALWCTGALRAWRRR